MNPFQLALTCAAAWCCSAALAHGDWPPKHGGRINEGGETSFELVHRRDGIRFHVEDHGEAVATAGSRAELAVTRGARVAHFDVKPAGRNELRAPGAHVRPGDRVTLKVTFANGSVAVGRFTLPPKAS